MQTDVRSFITNDPAVATTARTRLKGITITPSSVSLRNVSICDPTITQAGTFSRAGGTTTVTISNHGLSNGQRVYLNFTNATGSTMRDGTYDVSNVTLNTFDVTSVVTGTATGTAVLYTKIYLEIDTYNIISIPILIPGQGILCENGIYVGASPNTTTSVFYG